MRPDCDAENSVLAGPFKLRTYFTGLIVLFAAAAVAGVLYARHESRQNARTQALEQAAFAARSAAKLTGAGVSILQGALGGLANDPQVASILAHPRQCGLSFAQVGAFPSGHIDIVCSNGALVCSSLRASARRSNTYAGQSWFAAARSAPHTLAPVRDPLSGRPVAALTVPLHGAIVVALVDLDPVGPSLDMQLAGPKGLRYLVTSPDGKSVLARSTDPARVVGTSIVGTPFFRSENTAEHADLGGTTRSFAHAVVPGLGWRVYAGVEQSVALADANRIYDRELLIILAALLVVPAATALTQRRIARPIQRLSAAVRGGGRDAGTVVGGAPAEVAELAGSFDELVTSLRAAEQEASSTAEAYRELFDDHPLPMWIYDEDTLQIFQVNESAVAHYGYSREQFLSMTIKDLPP